MAWVRVPYGRGQSNIYVSTCVRNHFGQLVAASPCRLHVQGQVRYVAINC